MPLEGGKKRTQPIKTRDSDPKMLKAMTKEKDTHPAADPYMCRYRRFV